MRPEQVASDWARTTGHHALQGVTLQPVRLPSEDRAWARGFINEFSAAEDDDGLKQVVADYGNELNDLPRREALREELMTVLHRKAETEKMSFGDYTARMTAMDEVPLAEGLSGTAGREVDVASAAVIPWWLWTLAAGAGIVGTADGLNKSGKGKAQPMMPGEPPHQLPPSRPETGIDTSPPVTPLPVQEDESSLPGGGPILAPDVPPFPDQRDDLPDYTTLNIRTKHGDRFSVSGLLAPKDEMRIRNFVDTSPSPEMSKTLSEMINGQKVSMVKVAGSHLVNVEKSGGKEQWESDFERIRKIHGVAESEVKAYPNGTLVFVTPDGSSVNRRVKSSNGYRTVEIQVNYPDTGNLPDSRKVRPGLKLRYVE